MIASDPGCYSGSGISSPVIGLAQSGPRLVAEQRADVKLQAPIPVWVQTGSASADAACPFYPQQQTSQDSPGMSGSCQHRKLGALVNHVFVATAAPSRLDTTAAMVWMTGGGNHYLSRTIAPARPTGSRIWLRLPERLFRKLFPFNWNVWSS